VLGTRYIDEGKSTAGDGQSASPPTGTASPGATTPCPDFIGKAVAGKDKGATQPLALVLYIRTDHQREVWICKEADGTGLWYQGHERKEKFYDEGEIPVEGKNGLLLGGVTTLGSTYVAVNDKTTYRVSRETLTVTGNQRYTDTVIQALPPA
jgi:hypothetical protein